MKHPRIALIHATPLAIDPIGAAFGRLWPEARTTNLLDDSLSADLAAEGRLTDVMIDRFLTQARYVHSCGADAILFTCSAFGPAIEATAAAMPIPVLKPNEAMARAKKQSITITTRTLPDALAALQRGDGDTHDRLIADAAAELMPCEALVLGQFSMASAARLIPAQTGRRVLTSPDSAVLRLKETLRA